MAVALLRGPLMAPYDRGGTRFTLPRTVMDQSHLPSYAYRVIACRTVHDMSGGQHQPRRIRQPEPNERCPSWSSQTTATSAFRRSERRGHRMARSGAVREWLSAGTAAPSPPGASCRPGCRPSPRRESDTASTGVMKRAAIPCLWSPQGHSSRPDTRVEDWPGDQPCGLDASAAIA